MFYQPTIEKHIKFKLWFKWGKKNQTFHLKSSVHILSVSWIIWTRRLKHGCHIIAQTNHLTKAVEDQQPLRSAGKMTAGGWWRKKSTDEEMTSASHLSEEKVKLRKGFKSRMFLKWLRFFSGVPTVCCWPRPQQLISLLPSPLPWLLFQTDRSPSSSGKTLTMDRS